MLHPDTELVFMDAERGRGVRASAPIPRGTIVWAREHRPLPPMATLALGGGGPCVAPKHGST